MNCDTCDHFVDTDEGVRVLAYPSAWATAADTIAYCSPACEELAGGGDWHPELCVVCQREIFLNDSAYDLRDARALQFTTDASGNLVCRRCAGIPAGAAILPVGC